MTGKKLAKSGLVDSVSEKTGLNRRETRAVIDFFLEDIKNALAGGVNIELRGFGTFELRVRKGRDRARNPRTGEEIQVRSHGVAAFRPGRELRGAVRELAPGMEETENRAQ